MAGGQMQQRASTAAERRSGQAVGTYSKPEHVTEMLRRAQEYGHLVSPATSCGSLPPGCEVAVTAVLINIPRETYSTGGDLLGLAKAALDRISLGLGIGWGRPERLDDNSHPLVREYSADGTYMSFDGRLIPLSDRKALDLREGSPDVEAIRARCKDGKSAEKQLRDMRMFIDEHCITKARLRAIRSMGIRTGYTKEELEKPFYTARVMFTGKTDDPALRRLFAEGTMNAFLGGRSALFGGSPPPARYIDVGSRSSCGAPALPIADPHEDEPEPPRVASDDGGNRKPPPEPAAQRAEPQSQQPRQPKPGQIDTSQFVVPFGKNQGTPLNEASDRDLTYLADVLPKSIDDPEKSRYRAKNEALLAAVLAEQEYRELEGPGDLFDGAQDGAGGGF